MAKLIKGPYNLNKTFYVNNGTANLSRNAIKNLIAWWRLDTDVSTSGDIIDSSGNGHSCDFVTDSNRLGVSGNTPSGRIQAQSNNFDSTNSYAQIAASAETSDWNALIGGSGSDAKAFSISVWIRPSATIASEDTIVSLSYNDRVVHWWDGVGNEQCIKFYIGGDGAGGVGHIFTSPYSAPPEVWTHVVITYQGGIAGDLNVYINGERDNFEDNAVGDPLAIVGYPCWIGRRSGGGSPYMWDGEMADMAVWGIELPATDAAVLYGAKSGFWLPSSGFISNPPRTILQVRDCATGSYPTVSRIGDASRTGRYGVRFDDLDTVVFVAKNLPPETVSTVWVDAIDCTGLNARVGSYGALQAVSFGLYVPTGKRRYDVGLGTPIYVTLENDDDTGDAADFTYNIGIGDTTSPGDAAWAGYIIDAINGTTNSNISFPSYHEYGGDGILGIAAEQGTDSTKVTIRADNYQDNGIVRAMSASNGWTVLSPIAGAARWRHITLTTGSGGFGLFTPVPSPVVSYPTDLQPAAVRYISQQVATPNLNSTLVAEGQVIKGVADANISFTPGERFRPFTEEFLFAAEPASRTDPFYLTGSSLDAVGPGFTGNLGDKVKLEFDLSTPTATHCGFGEGWAGGMGSMTPDYHWAPTRGFSPMIYFNRKLRRWEPIGSGSNMLDGDPEDDNGYGGKGFSLTPNENWFNNSTIGFNTTFRYIPITKKALTSWGTPIGNFGFPGHPKFHATSSMQFPLSGVLDRPFVAEKWVLSFHGGMAAPCPNPGAFGSAYMAPVSWLSGSPGSKATSKYPDYKKKTRPAWAINFASALLSSFFILNQRGNFSGSARVHNVPRACDDRLQAAYHFPNTQALQPTVLTASIPSTFPVNQYRSNTQTSGSVQAANQMLVTDTRDLVTFGKFATIRNKTGGLWKSIERNYVHGFPEDINPNYENRNPRNPLEFNQALSGNLLVTNAGPPAFYAPPADAAPWWVISGSFAMSGAMQVVGTSESVAVVGGIAAADDGESLHDERGSPFAMLLSNDPGGRSTFGRVTGRGLTSETPGMAQGTGEVFGMAVTDLDQIFSIPTSGSFKEPVFRQSPYILMPHDSLIFGWQGPFETDLTRAPISASAGPGILSMFPGSARLTIYGAEVTHGTEHIPGLNQHLTSDAIHEFIGFHGPPLDQFETEYRSQYSGSIQSNIISGSIFGASKAAMLASDARQVMGQRSTSDWQAGQRYANADIKGAGGGFSAPRFRAASLSRTIRLEGTAETYYDCFSPDIVQMYGIDGGTLLFITSPADSYRLSLGYAPKSETTYTSAPWFRNFPFEPKFAGIRRVLGAPFGPAKTVSGEFAPAGDIVGWSIGTLPSMVHTTAKFVYHYSTPEVVKLANAAGHLSRAGRQGMKDFMLGTGDAISGSVGLCLQPSLFGPGIMYTNRAIRGFKYGMFATRERSPVAHYRTSRYGNVRDMLEQRHDSRFIQGRRGRLTINSAPVAIRFVTSDGTAVKPSRTASSNLSHFATSSLPYFDGVVKNRGPIVTADLGLSIVSV